MQSRISQFWKETLGRLHGTEESLTKVLQAYQQLQELHHDKAHNQSISIIEGASKRGEEELDSAERMHADMVQRFSEIHADHLAGLLDRVVIDQDASKSWQAAEKMATSVERYSKDARELQERRIKALHDHQTAKLAGLHRELHACCQSTSHERHWREEKR